jgi:hypothetical protein
VAIAAVSCLFYATLAVPLYAPTLDFHLAENKRGSPALRDPHKAIPYAPHPKSEFERVPAKRLH